MYILPTSTVRLLFDVPLTISSDDTFYWDNKTSQTNYFLSHRGVTVQNNTYVRKSRNSIKVGMNIDTIYNCNYMMFRNTNYENKWFYAFVTSIEYINEQTCEVFFEIDTLQTWFFEMQLKECFVERQHTDNDNVGHNIEPEPFGSGQYVSTKNTNLERITKNWGHILNQYSLVVATGLDIDEYGNLAPASGQYKNGIYSGLRYKVFNIVNMDWETGVASVNSEEVEKANNFLRRLNEEFSVNQVASLFLFPRTFCGTSQFGDCYAPSISMTMQRNWFTTGTDDGTSELGYLDGYKPKNNKLYTAPYNVLYCTTNTGRSNVYKIEFFKSTMDFQANSEITCNPSISMRPTNYVEQNTYDNSLTIGNFPQCAYNIDSFAQWVASNKFEAFELLAESVGDVIETSITGVPSDIDDVSRMIGLVNSALRAKTFGSQTVRSNNTSIDVCNNRLGFHFYHYCLNYHELKKIDDFFTMYGYAINRIAIPNIHARTNWTYVKTVGAIIGGDIPTDDKQQICNAFNKGIRFWSTTDIGNYDKTNSVLSSTTTKSEGE